MPHSLLEDRAMTADKIKSPLSSEITNQCDKSNIRQVTLEDNTERIFAVSNSVIRGQARIP